MNFVTDRNYNGLKVDSRTTACRPATTVRNSKLGIAGGMDLFGGRGHIEGSIEYFNSPGIFNKTESRLGPCGHHRAGAGNAASPYHLVHDTRLNSTSFGGYIPLANNAAPTRCATRSSPRTAC